VRRGENTAISTCANWFKNDDFDISERFGHPVIVKEEREL